MATKVFVGNLSFKIGAEKLREEFSAAGNVLSANIITRGPRSLGYGFVEFGSIEEAEKSVTLLNHKDIDGREINVEVAKPRAEPQENEKEQGGQQQQRRARRPRRPRGNSAANGEQQPPQQPQQQQQQRQNQPARNNNNRPQQQQQGGQQYQERRQYRPRYQNQDNTGAVNTTTTTTTTSQQQRRPRNPRNRRGPRQGGAQQQDQQQPQQPQQQFQRKKPAQPKKQQPQQERVASKSTLFVANLPFSVDDKELAEIFSKNLKVVSAHVVKKRNTRSKGFGFVEFENETDQLAALKEFDGATVHERVLNVKVALTAAPGSEEEAAGAEKPVTPEAAAPAEEKKEGEAPKAEPAKEAKAEEAAAQGEEKKGQ